MKVIITGCEYTGASTLARDFCDWLYDKYGGRGEFPPRFSVHDHFEIPDLIHAELDDSERDSMVALAPKLAEAFQRYNVLHHTPTLQSASQPSSGIMVLVGFHLAEAIYAQKYYLNLRRAVSRSASFRRVTLPDSGPRSDLPRRASRSAMDRGQVDGSCG